LLLLSCCCSSSGLLAYLYDTEPKVKSYVQRVLVTPVKARTDPVDMSGCDERYGAGYNYPNSGPIGGSTSEEAYDNAYKFECGLAKRSPFSATDFRKFNCNTLNKENYRDQYIDDYNRGIVDACAIIAPN
jgi:hypothetical protein